MEGGCSLRASVGSGNDRLPGTALDACDDAARAGEGCMRVVIVTGITHRISVGLPRMPPTCVMRSSSAAIASWC